MAWDPDALCDGIKASARASWCVENAGLSPDEARSRVVREFPAAFRASAAEQSPACRWDPDVVLLGQTAGARAKWCIKSCGLSEEAAQARVMAEFLSDFPPSAASSSQEEPSWNPEAPCGGHSAASRAEWCREHAGLSPESAKRRVMREFPEAFGGGGGGGSGPRWDPNALCDGLRAEDRAKWCMENQGLSEEAARQRVISEFPAVFGGAIAALGAASAAAVELVAVPEADPGALVWSDEFDYEGPPDPKKWGYDTGGHGWGNGELQHYTDRADNAWVADGCLKIRAIREEFGGNKFTSARLVTRGLFDFLYGRVEVRLKLPTARGAWAAAWMLPTDWAFGDWPRSGEIDIMEHVGHDTGKVHGTVHTEQFNHMKNTQVGRAVTVAAEDWHTYSVEWSPNAVSFIVDGKQYHRFPKGEGASWEAWPFDQRFHILLNIAVGGAWGGQQGIDEEAFAGEGQVMHVAWVRAYRLA